MIPGPLRVAKKRTDIFWQQLNKPLRLTQNNWAPPPPPFQLGVFFERLNYVMQKEESTAISYDKFPVFIGTWQPWILYKSSTDFQSWLVSNIQLMSFIVLEIIWLLNNEFPSPPWSWLFFPLHVCLLCVFYVLPVLTTNYSQAPSIS